MIIKLQSSLKDLPGQDLPIDYAWSTSDRLRISCKLNKKTDTLERIERYAKETFRDPLHNILGTGSQNKKDYFVPNYV